MTREIYRIFWTQTARRDLRRIVACIFADSLQAERVYLLIKEKVDNLEQRPLRGRIVPELEYFGILTYRELIVHQWQIIYRTEENKVWILAVVDSRRNMEDILLNRFVLHAHSHLLAPRRGARHRFRPR